MPDQITGERLTSLFRPRSVALVGASDKSVFSMIAYRNLVEFGCATGPCWTASAAPPPPTARRCPR